MQHATTLMADTLVCTLQPEIPMRTRCSMRGARRRRTRDRHFVTGDAADSIVEFSEAGTYDLRATISDDNGGWRRAIAVITVAAPASP